MFAAWESLLILKLTREEIICTLDSIAVSVFVILVELDKYSIRAKDPNNHSDTETGTLYTVRL